jgi:hypothetical protein
MKIFIELSQFHDIDNILLKMLYTVLIIIIIIFIFILFRIINLWFFKINDILKNQKCQEKLLSEQIKILNGIYIQLGGVLENISINEDYSDKLEYKTDKVEYYSDEIEDDSDEIEYLKKTLKNDELIVRVKRNGKIEKWKSEDWDEVIKLGNKEKFILIFKPTFD